jgi:hypothetical protein
MQSASLKSAGFFATLLLSFSVACGGSGHSTPAAAPTPAPTPTVAISISHTSAALSINGSTQFGAIVTGSTNTGVTWTVAETSGGSVNSAGLYKAPATAGTFHVVATSQADTTKSAKAAISVSAPSPVISSSAPTAAAQAAGYSYTILAVDPAGTGLTFALTSAPTGATISGNTVTWTPAPNQSRVPNNFTVTATSAAGGSSSQSWSIIPNGTITGTCIDTFYTANGSMPQVNDLTEGSFAALVPQADGSVLTTTGTGNSNGTFTIPNVPAGYYWLQMSFEGYVAYSNPSQNFWTSSSTIDCGGDGFGRPEPNGVAATLNWNLTNLAPSAGEDNKGSSLWGYNPNTDSSFYPNLEMKVGATTFVGTQSLEMTPVDPSQGDLAYLSQSQMSYNNIEDVYIWNIASTAALPSTFSIVNLGDIGNINAVMMPNSSSMVMNINLDFPSFAQTESVNPSYTTGWYYGSVQIQPFVADRVTPNWDSVNLVEFENSSASNTPQDFGSFNLGTQYPSTWPLTFSFNQQGTSTAQLTGAGSPTVVNLNIGQVSPTLPTVSTPAEPAISAIQNATINSVSFSGSQSLTGAITLAWSAPTGLTPYGYAVSLYAVDPESGNINYDNYLQFYTAKPGMTFPSQSLGSGTYLFVVEAMADSLAKVETAPFHYGLTEAWADAVSGFITYTYTGTSITPPTFFPPSNLISIGVPIGAPVDDLRSAAVKGHAAIKSASPKNKHASIHGFANGNFPPIVAR